MLTDIRVTMSEIRMKTTQPFLKWAGGKRWLVKNHAEIFPKNFNRYYEPFLGSGAVYFHLLPNEAVLSDVNDDLINSYLAVRDSHKDVTSLLEEYQNLHSKEFYYDMRARTPESSVERAAQFIYLNRTCWNGLYRVNLKGKFNVPIGTKTNVILDTDNFEALSLLLQNSDIKTQDFESTINQAGDGDFVFVDPPYTVKHNQNGFVKYNEVLFSWDDQTRLRDSVFRARDRGAFVLVTNADHASIRELYEGVNMSTFKRNSVIAGISAKRGMYSELIINMGK